MLDPKFVQKSTAAPEESIALVGGGLANTATLYELIRDIEQNQHRMRLYPKIRIFDIRKEFFTGGEAYAGSAPEMLFTNTFDIKEIKEKVGKDELLHHLADWLTDHKEEWVGRLKDLGNSKVDRWLSENKDKLETDSFEKIHLPRVVMSWFLEELVYDTVKKAEKLGVNVELIEGEVSGIDKIDDKHFDLSLSGKAKKITVNKDADGHVHFTEVAALDEERIRTNEVVLATGLPPRKRYKNLEGKEGYFDTQTTQAQDQSARHELIAQQILALYEKHSRPVKIGCIGTGPSFLDMVMLLDKDELVGKFELVGYSETGVLRHNYTDKATETKYSPEFLGEVTQSGVFVPRRFAKEEDFFHAIRQEMDRARQQDFGSKDVEYIARLYIESIKCPTTDGQHNFSYNPSLHSAIQKERGRVKLRNSLEQTDPNTAEAAERLSQQGGLRTVASKLEPENFQTSQNGFIIETKGTSDPFDIVINCTPREKLKDAPLIKIAMQQELIDFSTINGKDLPKIDARNRGSTGFYLGGAMAVDYVRNGEVVTGDVGVGAIMRHAKRISHGILDNMKEKVQLQVMGVG